MVIACLRTGNQFGNIHLMIVKKRGETLNQMR